MKNAVLRSGPGTASVNRAKEAKQDSTLDKRAMLADLDIRQYFPHITDPEVTRDATKAKGAQYEMGNFRKRLLSKSALKKIVKARNALVKEHYFLTLPWQDTGARILSANGYFDYKAKMRKLTNEFDNAVEEFVPQYEQEIDRAKSLLGEMFKESDYPTRIQIAGKFGVKVRILPLPTGDDFRVNIRQEEADLIRQEIESNSKAAVNDAMKEVWKRLYDVIEYARDRLKIYSVNAEGKVENTFRDSLIENIEKLLGVLPSLNIAGDPEIMKYARRIKTEISSHSPEALRNDPEVRKDVLKSADDILEKMKGIFA